MIPSCPLKKILKESNINKMPTSIVCTVDRKPRALISNFAAFGIRQDLRSQFDACLFITDLIKYL